MRRIICWLVVLPLLSGCSASRWDHEVELNEQSFDREAMQMVKVDSQLVLPEGARGLSFRYKPPIDPAFIARVAIPEEAVEQVRKQIEALKDEKINISGGLGERTIWWTPLNGEVIVDRQCHQSDNDYFRATLTREGSQIILYVDHAVF